MNQPDLREKPVKTGFIRGLVLLALLALPLTVYSIHHALTLEDPPLPCERITADDASRIAMKHMDLNPSIYVSQGYQTFEQFTAAMAACDKCVQVFDRKESPIAEFRRDEWSVNFTFTKNKYTFGVAVVINRCGKIIQIIQG